MLVRAIGFCVPMCSSQVMLGLEVVSTKGTYGILVPMNSIVGKKKGRGK